MEYKKIGRKVYYDIFTGESLVTTSERFGLYVSETTEEEDFMSYKILSERNKSTFRVINLEYGQYADEFSYCMSYRVNLDSLELEFSFEEDLETNEPIYEPPLTEQLKEIKERTKAAEDAILALMGGM